MAAIICLTEIINCLFSIAGVFPQKIVREDTTKAHFAAADGCNTNREIVPPSVNRIGETSTIQKFVVT